ncbi:MAG: cob(I)yrinic acid a,c-diamide adenosyltransferase [Anaerolineaceae bacterium]|nr:cob(I)yrinic acid a,c-diamide adenosyltransferase [Anaerolineaceae bacterium]
MTEKSFYTRTGDAGSTGIIGEGRVSKSDARIEAIGAIDEANAALGLFRSLLDKSEPLYESILLIQKKLYYVMSDLASLDAKDERFVKITDQDIEWLESQIAQYEQNIVIPKEFTVPGDHPKGAMMDVARTIVRRSERALVRFYNEQPDRNTALIKFMNRLSSFCYVSEIYVLKIQKDINITSVNDI